MPLPEPAVLADRLLQIIETHIVPKTRAGVAAGNKLFGAAILRKSDLSLVIAGTNAETENPLFHGEISTLNAFYKMPAERRPATGPRPIATSINMRNQLNTRFTIQLFRPRGHTKVSRVQNPHA